MIRFAVVALLAVIPLALPLSSTSFSQEPVEPPVGKVIALDAGHGGTEPGATYPANASADDVQVYEKDVNLAVVYELKGKLEAAGAGVVLTREADETITSRRERVNIAIEKCKSQFGRKCDALVSVHHNGSTDPSYDGLLVIYNEKQDLPLATAMHNALWSGLSSQPPSFVDEGFEHGGYGITVYGKLVSVLTESYYITNDWEAEQYLSGTGDRIGEEATALLGGLADYFAAEDGDGGGNSCSPGHRKQGKC